MTFIIYLLQACASLFGFLWASFLVINVATRYIKGIANYGRDEDG